jgi:predicted house-cleaning noncanonical NTP pyrophosphatase (MazG superfamily)
VREGYPIKLVRDKIRDLDSVHDGTVQIWAVGSTTRAKMLQAKLLEEVGEYLIDGGADELADVLEVVESLAAAVEGTSFERLREIQLQKRSERGGFRHGHVLFSYPPTGGDR